MDSSDVRVYTVHKNGEPVAHISGMKFESLLPSNDTFERFRKGDHDPFRIGVVPTPFTSSLTPELLSSLPVHYWAFGGMMDEIRRNEAPWVVEAGMLQARDIQSDGARPQGAYLVEINENKVSSVKFHALDVVRVAEIKADIKRIDKMSELVLHLNRSLQDIRKKSDNVNYVVRAVLTGAGKLHFELRSEGAVTSALTSLRHDGAESAPFVWWSTIEDRTESPVSSITVLRRQDFSAQMLWTSKQLLADSDRLSRLLQEQTTALENPAIGRWLNDLTESERAALMKEAVALNLGMLES
jgi:hypothetical protein